MRVSNRTIQPPPSCATCSAHPCPLHSGSHAPSGRNKTPNRTGRTEPNRSLVKANNIQQSRTLGKSLVQEIRVIRIGCASMFCAAWRSRGFSRRTRIRITRIHSTRFCTRVGWPGHLFLTGKCCNMLQGLGSLGRESCDPKWEYQVSTIIVIRIWCRFRDRLLNKQIISIKLCKTTHTQTNNNNTYPYSETGYSERGLLQVWELERSSQW